MTFLLSSFEAKELSSLKARSEEYDQMDKEDPQLSKKVRAEVSRYQRRNTELSGKHFTEKFENIIIAYLNSNRGIEYHPSFVALCAPFIYSLERECDAYFCFEKLMQALGNVLLFFFTVEVFI